MQHIILLHDEAIHQRKQLCVILANALDNAQLPYLEAYNTLFFFIVHCFEKGSY